MMLVCNARCTAYVCVMALLLTPLANTYNTFVSTRFLDDEYTCPGSGEKGGEGKRE